jgi:hypothetical protein
LVEAYVFERTSTYGDRIGECTITVKKAVRKPVAAVESLETVFRRSFNVIVEA